MAALLSDPFETLFQFQQALDAYRSSSWLGSSLSGVGAFPPINVFRKGDDVVIVAEAPGIEKSALQVQIKNNAVRIAGTKSVEYGDKASLHRRERLAGGFDRTITLPIEVNADGAKAECRDGILAIYLPRAERDKPKTIAVS
jgi:HSP20 family protein